MAVHVGYLVADMLSGHRIHHHLAHLDRVSHWNSNSRRSLRRRRHRHERAAGHAPGYPVRTDSIQPLRLAILDDVAATWIDTTLITTPEGDRAAYVLYPLTSN